ncbi:MAG: hypothetical protein B7Z75_06470 [Acidocella sp. 20-57-95]|nr:MAG: hypothetical protein B7Z75_06470 [Acidocella sp. 20-57-95]HQT64786.1 hypothetical protein [Acidocella sp.]
MNQTLSAVFARALENTSAYPFGRFEGRGIVICAGGPRYFICAYVLLHVLRDALGCTLPVQIWHIGTSELSPAMKSLLAGLGAEIVDAQPLLDRYPANIRNGWALKPFAVTHARFAEVLSLDADALPLTDPQIVFEWPEYKEHGALFWPDLVDLAAENPVWAAVGLPARREISFETGQFVVDKQRCWAALNLTIALNSESERLYQMIYGEKDSFLLAFLLYDQLFHRIGHRPLNFDSDLLQLTPSGTPFIHHRTFSKFSFTGPNRPVFGDALTPAVEGALQDLRANWTGIVFHPPFMSPAAQRMADQLAECGFIYQTSGAGARRLILERNFQVGTGRAEYEQHWAVIEQPEGLVLQFFSATRLAIELHPQGDGSWYGATSSALAFSARLIPEHAWQTIPFAGACRVSYPAAAWLIELCAAVNLNLDADATDIEALQAALHLINRTHDDLPEALADYLSRETGISPAWRSALAKMLPNLTAARDAQRQRTQRSAAPMDLLRPGFYDRDL